MPSTSIKKTANRDQQKPENAFFSAGIPKQNKANYEYLKQNS